MVGVYDASDTQLGTLTATADESDANKCTFSGPLDTAPTKGDVLTLKFLSPNYATQDGTLETIATTCDYATASVTVSAVDADANTISTSDADFENQQAIVRFTLKDEGNSDAPVSASQLTVEYGSSTITVTPASATDVLYVALPGFSGQTVTLTATAGSSSYTYEKANVTFANGQYYAITVKMTEQSASPRTLVEATTEDIGKIAGADGNIYATQEAAEAAGTTAVAMIAYVGSDAETSTTYNHGLALALKDAGTKKWCSQTSATCLGTQYSSESDAKGDMAGIANTDALVNQPSHTHAAATAARNYQYADGVTAGAHPKGTSAWFLPSAGQWDKMATAADGYANLKTNAALQSSGYWSSSVSDAHSAWYFYPDEGYCYNDYKNYDFFVRACLAF